MSTLWGRCCLWIGCVCVCVLHMCLFRFEQGSNNSDNNNNSNNNNNNNHRIERRIPRFFQSCHCVANCLQHVRSSVPGAIVCKSHAAHQAYITCNLLCATWYSSAIKFDRVEITFTLALFYWLKPLTDEGCQTSTHNPQLQYHTL